jgi:hypothetical protein
MLSSIFRQLSGFVQVSMVSGDTKDAKAVRKETTIISAARAISSNSAMRTELIIKTPSGT